MRRLCIIAAIGLLLGVVPAFSQRGGGHGSAGGHGGGMAAHGSFGGHAGGGHAFGGAHSGPGMGSRGAGRGFARQPFSSSRNSFRNFNRFRARGPIISNFRGRRFGRGNWGWPWWGAYDPWWWDSGSSSSYDPDYERQLEIAQEMNAQSLDEQRARQEQDQDLYARSGSAPPQQAKKTEAAPATVLVFRDQRKVEVQNYAIVGQTLWNFAPQHTQKIPLSEIDLAATQKANDERGVDFRVPGASEAQ